MNGWYKTLEIPFINIPFCYLQQFKYFANPEYGRMERDKMDSMVSYNLVMIFGDYLVRRNNRDSTVLNVYLDDRGYITDLSIEDGFNQRKIPPDVQELLSNTIGRRFEIDSMEVNDTLIKVKLFLDQ